MIEGRRAGIRLLGCVSIAVMGVLLAGPASAPARGPRPAADAAKPFFDSRVAARSRARAPRLRHALGNGVSVEVDPLTGTARSVQRLDGALTGTRGGDRTGVARQWVRAHRTALGLTATDVDPLTLSERTVSSGLAHLRFTQTFRGIPVFDGGLEVNLDRHGRILSVTGAPVSGLRVPSVTPRLSAAKAMRALQENVGVRRRAGVDDFAHLVVFDGAAGARLAWHLTYRASSLAHYDAVVDATTGAILFRQNLVKFAHANQTVFPNYPGAPGGQVIVNFEDLGWLSPSETNLDGTFVHAFSDVNDSESPQPSEEITRASGQDYPDDFQPFAPTEDDSCAFTPPPPAGWPAPIATTAQCSWDPTMAGSWQTNREQNGVQAFYLANVFHDHLAAPPIGFSAAEGSFEDSDKLVLHTDDGAATGPDNTHLDNATMETPPDGHSPTMQMFLFRFEPDADFFNVRNVNGGDSAAIVWHEYTHGLSNRLITYSDGSGALNTAQAAAMGEGWSDWYALDYVVQSGLESDDPATPGEIDVGAYIDAVFASTRFEPIDCRVEDTLDPHCQPPTDAGRGGYTFGDFGHVANVPEEHSDGEIWAQTLWDLRRALGSYKAERLITEGMRMSPPEPSFLDARNAILAADAGLGNADRDTIWAVFAHRGMGYDARTSGSSDTTPIEDFHAKPNVPPSGTLGAGATRVSPSQAVALTASFTDSDSSIVGYDWDFDGNGTVDQTTATPAVTFAYSTSGDFTARVTVRDSRGGAGTGAVGIHVTAAPRIGKLPKTGRKASAKFRVACDASCTVTAKLTVSKKMRRKLGLRSRTVGTLKRSLAASTSKRLTIKLTATTKRALKRHHMRKLKATLAVTARYSDGRHAGARRSVTIKR
jgi:extracellular elastinolytic metalloproteinase